VDRPPVGPANGGTICRVQPSTFCRSQCGQGDALVEECEIERHVAVVASRRGSA